MRLNRCYCLLIALIAGTFARADAPTINGEPVIQANGAAHFIVQGEFRPSMASARESALRTAQERLRAWLGRQDPPIQRVPSIEAIRRDMNLRESLPQEEDLNPKERMYKITMEIELQPALIRALRERERVVAGTETCALILAILGVVVLLFRMDEWTRGYLNGWLIAMGVVLIGSLAVLGWFLI